MLTKISDVAKSFQDSLGENEIKVIDQKTKEQFIISNNRIIQKTNKILNIINI